VNTATILRLLCLLFILALTTWAQPSGHEMVSLFNGKDLAGWIPMNNVVFTVTNGCIHMSKASGWLRSEKPYTNFVFEAEWRALETNYNSGFFLRAGLEGKPFPTDVWQVNPKESALGSLMKGSKTVVAFPTTPGPRTPPLEWVTFRMEARGTKLMLEINGKQAWQFEQFDAGSGYLGLQAEGRPFEFRNLRIQELP
jgi:hypothetical protein